MATELPHPSPNNRQPVASREHEPGLDAALKRCSAATYRAAVRFRRTGKPEYLPAIVSGVIERFVDQTLRPKFDRADEDSLRLREDLGFDSLTMMEMLMLAEEVLQVSIDNAELRALQTVGDVKTMVVQMVPHRTNDPSDL